LFKKSINSSLTTAFKPISTFNIKLAYWAVNNALKVSDLKPAGAQTKVDRVDSLPHNSIDKLRTSKRSTFISNVTYSAYL
jgi:hypothetical protein